MPITFATTFAFIPPLGGRHICTCSADLVRADGRFAYTYVRGCSSQKHRHCIHSRVAAKGLRFPGYSSHPDVFRDATFIPPDPTVFAPANVRSCLWSPTNGSHSQEVHVFAPERWWFAPGGRVPCGPRAAPPAYRVREECLRVSMGHCAGVDRSYCPSYP